MIFKNKKIKLNKISSNFSIKSFLYKEFAIKNLSIFTDENNINNIISFLRLYKNTPQLFIFDKVVKTGTIKSVIKLNFDDEGNIIDDYKDIKYAEYNHRSKDRYGGKWKYELGCCFSHIKAIKMAYEAGLEEVFIVEDDIYNTYNIKNIKLISWF